MIRSWPVPWPPLEYSRRSSAEIVPDPNRRAYAGGGGGEKAAIGLKIGMDARPAAPLLVRPPTGYSQPGCFTALAEDCSVGLTLEHPVSRALLEVPVGHALRGDAEATSLRPWKTTLLMSRVPSSLPTTTAVATSSGIFGRPRSSCSPTP